MRRLAILAGSAVLIVVAPALPSTGGAATAWAQAPKHNCEFCHNLHGGSFEALRDTAVVEDLCDSCHGTTQAEPDSILRDGTWVQIPKNGGAGFAIHNGAKHAAFSREPTGCWDCHNHEGEAGSNLSMIQASMPTPVSGTLPVVFTSRGSDAGQPTLNSFADGDENNDGDYTGVCEVCHTETSNHQNGLNLPDNSNHAHEVGRTCTDCHGHDAGFAGGGPCASCHDTGGQGTTGPNNRRAIIPEMSRASHHVGSIYQDDDCLTCHEFTQHQQGQVRLQDADDGSVTVWDGSGSTLESFCLSCHDADGASLSGGLPFSDGLAPPNVAGTWGGASHNTTGNYTCWDCHDNAHGSLKRKLLAPNDVGPGTDNVDEEEGFCFNCHSSSGAATSDVQSQYDSGSNPIRWAQDAWGLNSVSTFNDRHDLAPDAQTTSGAKIECTDCHDPHQANAAQPWKIDPDPGDTHNDPGTPDWTGQSAKSWFCVDCHDGSFPTTVQDHQPTGMVNILNTWLNVDRMGVVNSGGNQQLRTQGVVDNLDGSYSVVALEWGQGDIMNCEVCHRAHPKTDGEYGNQDATLRHDLFALQDSVRNQTSGLPLAWSIIDAGSVTDSTFNYALTIDVKRNADPWNAGGYFCNTCHDRDGMNGKNSCGTSNCHAHGGNPGM